MYQFKLQNFELAFQEALYYLSKQVVKAGYTTGQQQYKDTYISSGHQTIPSYWKEICFTPPTF